MAAFEMTCPHCDERNRVYFEPNGVVRRVAGAPEFRRLLESSIN